jgi:hypothetical protein
LSRDIRFLNILLHRKGIRKSQSCGGGGFLLNNVSCNSVKLNLTFLGDDSGVLLSGRVLVLLEDLQVFKCFKSPSEDFTETSLVFVSKIASVLVGAENVLEGGNTSVWLQVNLSG